MQGFVSGIGHHETKSCKESVEVARTSWMTSTQCLTITFQSFANGIKVSNTTAASEMYSEIIYLC